MICKVVDMYKRTLSGFRVAPFWFGIRCLKGLIAVAVGGLINTALVNYADINVVEMLKQRLF